jgi:hypothetical protein
VRGEDGAQSQNGGGEWQSDEEDYVAYRGYGVVLDDPAVGADPLRSENIDQLDEGRISQQADSQEVPDLFRTRSGRGSAGAASGAVAVLVKGPA